MVRMIFGTPLEPQPAGGFSGPSKVSQASTINRCRGLADQHYTSLSQLNSYGDLSALNTDKNDMR